ncbi:DNA excision repair protein ERCC-6-like [Sphaeramia orbicularis]|uniref:DNA excision repair protein ERCC-6-like n=1 Tax=Sphaeramia orbicularis TaxID=375764 RepID=UPI00117D977E|nr:DNA excision repair protein ERCC-6-like [Sphaeramia orbicularis]
MEGEVTEISDRLNKSLSMNTDGDMDCYNRLVQEAKDVARAGDMMKALELFKEAFECQPSEKLRGRIQRIEAFLAENDSEDEDDEEFVDVDHSGLMLFKELHDKLYEYQREGVAFLYSLYRDGRKGGILADDMGLGKTIQVIAFLSGMYDGELLKHALLIVPTSLITNWTKEFSKWTPGMRVKEFHGTSTRDRTRNLEKVQRRGGVLITTYSMLLHNWQDLASHQGREFCWDYVILDEAHKIKSTTTKTAKCASSIPSKNRVLLTGTPVQNNLQEMWALFNFACQGALLGTAKTFKTEYENPITRARMKDATPGEKALGLRMSENLQSIIAPYFLRRTKAHVQKNKTRDTHPPQKENSDSPDPQVSDPPGTFRASMPTLTRKNDLIVWTYLSEVQESIYRQFISLDHIQELLMTSRSPLAQLTILKKLCDHPRLLSAGAMAKLGLDQSQGHEADVHGIDNVPDQTLISESGKLVFLVELLERLREEGHRTLVFAHYRKILDMIERILKNRGFRVVRMDGSILQKEERERRIALFQTDQRYSVFLLTTQVGGVGITLTAADRVVIYDPSWNPATDAQAVDRAYRIGQTENVIIYRLITCGTVEEKIYRRQVFKDSLIRQNTGDKKNPFRYFSKQDLKELFTLEDVDRSRTQMQLQDLHSRHRRTDPQLDRHIAHLHTMRMFGISDHDLMFSVNVNRDDEAVEDQEEHCYIEGRVQKAQELMEAESELQVQLARSVASNTEAAWLQQPVDQSKTRNLKSSPDQTKTRNLRSSPAFPPNVNRSANVEELNQSRSGARGVEESLSEEVMDLTQAQSPTDQPDLDSPKPQRKESGYVEGDSSASPKLFEESSVLSGDTEATREPADPNEPRNPQSSPAHPRNGSGHVEEPDKSATNHQTLREDVIEISDDNDPKKQPGLDHNSSVESPVVLEVTKPGSSMVVDPEADEEAVEDGDPSVVWVKANDTKEHLNGTSQKDKSITDCADVCPFQNQSLSLFQTSCSGSRADTSSTENPGLESFEGFNLQLEDSDGDHVQDDDRAEDEQRKLLLQLQADGSFDVQKSLSERRHNGTHDVCEMDTSANDSVVAFKKKRTAVISDSDDEEDEDQQFQRSFQLLRASTPKSTPVRSRKSVGGNTSVASRRSFILSIIDDMENQDELMSSTEAEEENALGLMRDEPSGETLNTEDDREDDREDDQEDDREESTAEEELESTEMMERCAAEEASSDLVPESQDYEGLVSRGRSFRSGGKLEEALSCFLKAVDIRPGDSELQLTVIHLFQQLSRR